MAIYVRDSFLLLPQLAPDTQTLRPLKLIYNTKRSSDKQSECVNVRPNKLGIRHPRKKERKSKRLDCWDLLAQGCMSAHKQRELLLPTAGRP